MSKTRKDQLSVDRISSSKLDKVIQITEFRKHKLPTNGEVIGRVYQLVDTEKKTFAKAISNVAHELSIHWTERNVYPVSEKTIIKRITHRIDGTAKEPGYRQVKKIAEDKRNTPAYSMHCDRVNKMLVELCDIFCEDKEQRKKIEESRTKMEAHVFEVSSFIYTHFSRRSKQRGYRSGEHAKLKGKKRSLIFH